MKEKRNELIKQYILQKNHVTLKELEDEFNVSMNTIRRDVNLILEDSRFEKVYGGVSVKKDTLINFADRNIANKEAKQRIAQEAAKFIEEDDLIYIDSGTTTKYILDYLDQTLDVSIITNSLDVIIKAEKMTNVTLFLAGHIFKKSTRSFVGVETDDLVNRYNINKAFMAATAVSINGGLMNSDVMEYDIKKQMLEKANKTYLLTDHNKFGKSTLLTYANLTDVDCVITDDILPKKYRDFLDKHTIDFIETNIDN